MTRLAPSDPPGRADWHRANQRHLSAALAVLVARVARAAPAELASAERALAAAAAGVPGTPALLALAERFQLSPFERDVLLLCAGVELDGDFAARLGGRGQASFALALAHLPEPHWSALAPAAPLRRHRLIELAAGEPLTRATLRIDERVLHFLAGVDQLDERLADLLVTVEPPGELPASQAKLAERLVGLWRNSAELPVVQLVGDDPAAKRAVAAAACENLGVVLYALPVASAEPGLARLLTRELLLGDAALLVDAEELGAADSLTGLRRLLDQLDAPVVVAAREPLRLGTRASVQLTAERPTHAEQETWWRRGLGARAEQDGLVAPLVAQFDLPTPAIRNACAATVGVSAGELPAALWEACRAESRGRLDDLAQRIEPSAGWDELVLPASHKATLHEIVAQVRQRTQVYDRWGFGGRGKRGLGISALFAGASGTGKTMAAEVLAATLRLDLYRIDLSQVVNKYIGETEKNLRRVFDAAEHGAAILLFDEADALFGQRSEVKDSHDRYANIEVGYLLQRMEAYRGLAILTTNLKNALDTAFLRRLRFVVPFPFPGASERAAIWRGVFPAGTPTEGLDAERLARLNVAGGSIRNIALNAAFLAAAAGEPVRMGHLTRAAQVEYAKLERPFSSSELG